MALLECPEEIGVRDAAAQGLVGDGGTGEAGGMRWDAEENLGEGVVGDVLRLRRRRPLAVVAAHGGTHCCVLWTRLCVLQDQRSAASRALDEMDDQRAAVSWAFII